MEINERIVSTLGLAEGGLPSSDFHRSRVPKVEPRAERAVARRFPELRVAGFSRYAVLRWMQPQRPSVDVFPTVYRLNTPGAVRQHFNVIMFAWNSEPRYMEDNLVAVCLLSLVRHRPGWFASHWSIFIQKKSV